MECWDRLPEVLRWILYLPVVIVLPAVIGLIVHLILAYSVPGWRWFRPIANFWVAVFGAYLMVQATFPIVFLFAPRGRRSRGGVFTCCSCCCARPPSFSSSAVVLGTWGLLGDALRPPDGVVGWEATDWNELGQTIVWLVVGTMVFRKCLEEENQRLTRSRMVMEASASHR